MVVDRLSNQVTKEGRDLAIFAVVVERGPIGIVRLAEETGLPKHKVRYSLRMLENDGMVEPTPQGAVPPEDVGERIESIDEGVDHLVERLEGLKAINGADGD